MSPSETPPSQQSPSPFGVFRRDFRVVKHKLKRDFRIGFGLLFVILALIALVAGFYTSWNAVRLHGRAALLQTIPLPLLIFLLGLLLGILLLSYTRRHWHDRVSIYENGLVLQKGKESTPWLWDGTACFKAEITAIKFGTGMIGEKVRLVFENAQGQKLLLPGRYEEMNSLVELVRQSLLPRMYKNTVDRMLKGESIPFTPELNAVLKGLVIREDLCRWAALNPPQLTKGALILSRIGDNKVIYKTPIKKVGNLDLLLTFLENPPTG
jgi:hypothetical protein